MSRQCECPPENADCAHPTCPRWPQVGHQEKASPGRPAQTPLWLVALHPRALRVRFGDWLWLRRHKHSAFGDYVVEIGGQRLTHAQWEAARVAFSDPPCTCPDPEIAARSGHVSQCGATR